MLLLQMYTILSEGLLCSKQYEDQHKGCMMGTPFVLN